MWLRLEYRLPHTPDEVSYLPYVRIKVPSGDRALGLATGYADFEAGLGLRKDIDLDWSLTGHLGYRLVGVAPAAAARNDVTYDVSVRYTIDPHNQLQLGVSGRQYLVAGATAGVIGSLSWNHWFAPRFGLQSYLQKAAGNGGPDLGFGVSALINIR